MDLALAALGSVDFQWTTHIDSVWNDLPFHVPELQRAAREQVLERLAALRADASMQSPLGIPLLGPAGAGKTHLLNTIRKEALGRDLFFVLVDLTDVNDFYETLLLGTLRSLSQDNQRGRPQLHSLLEFLLQEYGDDVQRAEGVAGLSAARPPGLINRCNRLIHAVRKRHPRAQEHQDVLRALLLLGSDDFDIVDLGDGWLQGVGVGSEDAHRHGFRHAQQRPRQIFTGVSWVMSLAQPTVLALDQLDAIVAEHNLASADGERAESSERQRLSLSIIQGLSGGLMALRDAAKRTQIVVSCLEATWAILDGRSPVSMRDRYEPPILLHPLSDPDVLRNLVAVRLAAAYARAGFSPPYPCHPYRDAFFTELQRSSPREVLKACDAHRRECLRRGSVIETGEPTASIGADELAPIQARFEALQREAPVDKLLAEEDDEALDGLIESACLALAEDENTAPADVDVAIDLRFPGRGAYEPLHARIRMVYRSERDRERHYAFRFLQKSQCRAFQARLKAAITSAGIVRDLPFRRLAVLRVGAPPRGPVSEQLVADLRQRGGVLIAPNEEQLRTLWAVQRLRDDPAHRHLLPAWLAARRPVSRLAMFRDAVAWLFGASAPSRESTQQERRSAEAPATVTRRTAEAKLAPPDGVDTGSSSANMGGTSADSGSPSATVSSETTEIAAPSSRERRSVPSSSAVLRDGFAATLPLGERLIAGSPQETVTLPLENLRKHTVILAGAGSGKTVLLKRLIEEAVLVNVPAIVIDGANDLSLLGDTWSSAPEGWGPGDADKARRYHEQSEVIIWTPGVSRGNPLSLNPIPDLAALAEDPDELNAALAMVVSSLAPIAAPSKGSGKGQVALGVLMGALQYFARHGGGTLRALISLLRDLPPEACEGFEKGDQIARQMSERLLAETKMNPLLGETGSELDPRTLLGEPERDKTRVSVINLSGLQGETARQQFVDQLCMTLFSFIKKHPARDRPLLGLLVVDEARDFVPSGRSVPGKENMIQLVAQARKYGLGILFATQAPKGIDNKVIANCATQFYGRAAAPAAIQTVQEQLRLRGGSGSDIARLTRGVFYAHTEGMTAPARIATRMCLSAHPPSPPSESEVIARARRVMDASVDGRA